MKAAIHFGSPARPPIASLLPCSKALEELHGERLRSLRSRHPDDVVGVNITIDYWTAPPDDPHYRFAMDGIGKPPAAAIDAAPVIPFHRDDGGLILGAGNVLTEDIPWEHIEAYAEAVSEFAAGHGRLERG